MRSLACSCVVLVLSGCRPVAHVDEAGGTTSDASNTSTNTTSSETTIGASSSETTTSGESSTGTDTGTGTESGTETGTGTESGTDTGTGTDTSTDTGTETTDSTTGEPIICGDPVVPTDGATLLEWLQNGTYLQWQAESGPHHSSGPHFGDVRTYVHPCLAQSLDAFAGTHPVGAASVKELFGEGGNVVLGWSVEVKVVEGVGGDTWYWYERYNDVTNADSIGDVICADCHAEGQDMFTSFWPLL